MKTSVPFGARNRSKVNPDGANCEIMLLTPRCSGPAARDCQGFARRKSKQEDPGRPRRTPGPSPDKSHRRCVRARSGRACGVDADVRCDLQQILVRRGIGELAGGKNSPVREQTAARAYRTVRTLAPILSFFHSRSVVRTAAESLSPSARHARSPRERPKDRVAGRRAPAEYASSASNG